MSMGRLFSRISSLDEFFFILRGRHRQRSGTLKSYCDGNLCRVSRELKNLTLASPTSWESLGELLYKFRTDCWITADAFAPATPGYIPKGKGAYWYGPRRLRGDFEHTKWFCFFELEPPYNPWMKLWSKRSLYDACGELIKELRAQGARPGTW